jgi:hypothetical protein
LKSITTLFPCGIGTINNALQLIPCHVQLSRSQPPRGTLPYLMQAPDPHAKPHNNILICQVAGSQATAAATKQAASAPRNQPRPTTYFFPRIALALLVIIATSVTATPAQAVIRIGEPNTVALTSGLVGYWPLDGAVTNWTNNTTADLSGQGNTGTLTNLNITTTPAIGVIGQAFNSVSSNNSSVSMGTPSILNLTSDMSISLWYKDKNDSGAILANDDSNSAEQYGLFARVSEIGTHLPSHAALKRNERAALLVVAARCFPSLWIDQVQPAREPV